MWQLLRQHAANMWLYYVVLHVWLSLGDNEFVVRSLSAIFAVAAVPILHTLGNRLLGRRVGLLAVLLLPFNTFFVEYAQEARGYSLLLLLTTLSSYFFARTIEEPRWSHWAGYAISSVLAIYTHFFGALVLLAQTASLVFIGRQAIPWKRLAISGFIIALFLLPITLFQPLRSGQTDWLPPPTLKDLLRVFVSLGGSSRSLQLIYAILCMAGLGLVIIKFLRFRWSRVSWHYAFLATWLVLPIITAFLFSFIVAPIIVDRYFIICLPPFVLLAAIGLSHIRQRWLLAASLAVLIILSGISLSRWYTDYEKENWRGAAAYVLSQAEPGDAVVFYAYFVRHAFEYYLDNYTAPSGSLDLLELASEPYSPFGGGRQPDPDQSLIQSLPDQYRRVWLVLSHDQFGHLERTVQSQLIQQSLQRAYAVSHERDFAMIRVLLYERRGIKQY